MSGVDVRWHSEPALPEAAKAVRYMPSDSPATAQEAVDTAGVWASTMVVTTTDGDDSSVAALSAAAASPAPTMLAIEGSPPKTATGHDRVAGTRLPDSGSTAGAARPAQSGWDALTASADAAGSGVKFDQPGTAVPRHALAAELPLSGGQHNEDGAAADHAPVAFGPSVRSHRTIEVQIN